MNDAVYLSCEYLPVAGSAFCAVAVFPALQVVLVDPAAQPWLLALQVWRIEGVAFLVLFALGQLPALFALPAGIGDLAIGVTAPLVARNLHRRNLALAWNVLGLADLVVAVSLGVMTNPGPLLLFATTPTSDVLTAFPMALASLRRSNSWRDPSRLTTWMRPDLRCE